jgi:hypothetical protein
LKLTVEGLAPEFQRWREFDLQNSERNLQLLPQECAAQRNPHEKQEQGQTFSKKLPLFKNRFNWFRNSLGSGVDVMIGENQFVIKLFAKYSISLSKKREIFRILKKSSVPGLSSTFGIGLEH